jgi:glycosyltransferase involved in cell wall biosynthesis
MVTPHLPPHQAANALLPHLLGAALEQLGHSVRFLTFGEQRDTPRVSYLKRRGRRLRATRLPQLLEGFATWRKARPLVEAAQVVHIHSNTWMNQVAARLARRRRRPYVLTHYGTEIWHHDGRDRRFRALNRDAAHVAFYSRALYERGRELGVPCRRASVIYPPVAGGFRPLGEAERGAARRELGYGPGLLLLNVKRLHPLADQATLLRAMARVKARRPDARLLIAGSGECEAALRALSRQLELSDSLGFLGLVPNQAVARLQSAADLFVLPSLLEATPTVALEALAAGTPVISADNPGGLELHGLFGEDVALVPKQDAEALAGRILAFAEQPRRAGAETARTIEERFRLEGSARAYLALYEEALAG